MNLGRRNRLIVLAPQLSGRHGHDYEYNRRLQRVAFAFSLPLEFWVPDPEALGLVDLGSLRSLASIWKFRRPSILDRIQGDWGMRVRHRWRSLFDVVAVLDIANKMRREGPGVTFFVHTADLEEIRIVLEAAARAGLGRDHRCGQLVILLRYDHYDDLRMREQISKLLRRCELVGATVLADTRTLADLLQSQGPLRIGLAPIPSNGRIGVRLDRRVGYFGSRRRQKGFMALPGLIDQLTAMRPEVRIFVQAYLHPDESDDRSLADVADKIAAYPSVEIERSVLSGEDFAQRMAECSVVLIPYDPLIYRAASSGVFTDAIVSGCKVVARRTPALEREVADFSFDGVWFYDAEDVPVELVIAALDAPAPSICAREAYIAWNRAETLIHRVLVLSGDMPP